MRRPRRSPATPASPRCGALATSGWNKPRPAESGGWQERGRRQALVRAEADLCLSRLSDAASAGFRRTERPGKNKWRKEAGKPMAPGGTTRPSGWLTRCFHVHFRPITAAMSRWSRCHGFLFTITVPPSTSARGGRGKRPPGNCAADAGSDFNARLYELVQDFEYKDRILSTALGRGAGVPYLQWVYAAGYRHCGPGHGKGKRRKRLLYGPVGGPEDHGCDRAFLPLQRTCWGRGGGLDAGHRPAATLITVFAALVAPAILLFVLYTSSYFMNSIIVPVGEVSGPPGVSPRAGLHVRLDTHNDDEIGQLCASIDNMGGGADQ